MIKTITKTGWILATLIAVPAFAKEYVDVRPAIIEAIDAPDGKASGTLVGPIANRIASTTGSSAPVTINITTVKRFNQAGCSRLQIVLRQENVPTTTGTLATYEPVMTMNVCRDGSPPTEGMDMEEVGKYLSERARQ